MDSLICNKCFDPMYRGKQPYNITQCGHISCQSCLQQVEKQCPQCQYVGAISLPLKEPLVPSVVQFFVPLAETLETLLKVDMFRSNQMKITMQRFHNIDKKYEMIKTQYWLMRRSLKELTEKYMNIKAEKEKLDKRLLRFEMHQDIPRSAKVIKTPMSNVTETPSDSGIFTHPSSARYSSESSEFLKSVDIISMRSGNTKRNHKTADGFRIPRNRRPPQYVGSLATSEASSNCSFTR